jgi:hypothetical protein
MTQTIKRLRLCSWDARNFCRTRELQRARRAIRLPLRYAMTSPVNDSKPARRSSDVPLSEAWRFRMHCVLRPAAVRCSASRIIPTKAPRRCTLACSHQGCTSNRSLQQRKTAPGCSFLSNFPTNDWIRFRRDAADRHVEETRSRSRSRRGEGFNTSMQLAQPACL